MNRHERRRRAKLGNIVEIDLGRVVFDIKPGEDISRDLCYVCDKPATAWPVFEGSIPAGSMAHGVAAINGEIVLLCEGCFNAEDQTNDAIARKYLNAPDLKISDGGTVDDNSKIHEIADALKERGDKPTN